MYGMFEEKSKKRKRNEWNVEHTEFLLKINKRYKHEFKKFELFSGWTIFSYYFSIYLSFRRIKIQTYNSIYEE